MGYLSWAQQENIRVYKEYYSKFAREYEERTREEAKIIAETMTKWVTLDSLKILDLGVGTGSVWEQLYLKGISDISVTGLDIATGMLKIAKEKGIPWLKVLEKQVENSDYTNCFDMVCAHGLLKHCADPGVAVERAYKALIESGRFFVEDLSFEDDVLKIMWALAQRIRDYLKPGKRKTSFHLEDDKLLQIIESVGFKKQRYKKVVYSLNFDSFERIRDFFIKETMFGLYTYKTVPLKHRKQCDTIFLQTIRDELEKPVLQRRTFLSLFKKI